MKYYIVSCDLGIVFDINNDVFVFCDEGNVENSKRVKDIKKTNNLTYCNLIPIYKNKDNLYVDKERKIRLIINKIVKLRPLNEGWLLDRHSQTK